MAPNTGSWDPVLLISQIVAIQALHYLSLSVLIPPLLFLFAEPNSLNYEGGAANVGMIMDWRELASRPTVRGMQGSDRWKQYTGAWRGGKQVGFGDKREWDGRIDPMRGWVIAFSWQLACLIDIYPLYTLIRRPRMILDFALTLLFNHLLLTTYYSASIPTSLFFYIVVFVGAAASVMVAEQLCVKREMREGLSVLPLHAAEEEVELVGLGRRD